MFRVFAIFLFSTLPAILCAQNDKKKEKSTREPAKIKVVKLNEPQAHIGKYANNTEVQKSELLKCDSLQIKHCFNLPADYVVSRFRFSAFIKGQYVSYLVRSGKLSAEVKKAIAEADHGTQIKFRTITAWRKVKNDTVQKEFPDVVMKVIDDTDTSLITYKLKNRIPEPGLFSLKKQLPPKVTRLDLLFVDQLIVKCDCKVPALSTEFEVEGFDLRAYHNGNRMVYSTSGSDLTQEMRDALAHAKTGTRFCIENIRVRTADGLTGYLRPRTFKVIP